ncbi:MAG: cold-shock protein [Roseiarcus sp.]|jgi:hypothetical protein
MARDEALEAWLREALRNERNVGEKAMFGGLAWLLNGHLQCASREDGMLARVGTERNAWALALSGVGPMVVRGRALDGWVRAAPPASVETRGRLLDAALAFVRSLPAKKDGARARAPARRSW